MACPSLQPLPCWLRQRGNLFLVVLGIFLMLVFKSRPKNSTCHPRRGRPGCFRAARASPVCPDTPARRSRHLCFVRHPTSTASDVRGVRLQDHALQFGAVGTRYKPSKLIVERTPDQHVEDHRKNIGRPLMPSINQNLTRHRTRLFRTFQYTCTHGMLMRCKQLCERRRACQATMPLNIF